MPKRQRRRCRPGAWWRPAQAQPAWEALPPASRGQLLRDLARLILENRERLARWSIAEQGKPIHEARGEIEGAALYLTYAAEEARRITGDIIPSDNARRADLDPARRPWRGRRR